MPNDCPAERWSALDPQALATERKRPPPLNGPAIGLMNAIEKAPQGPPVTKTFGGIEMLQQYGAAVIGEPCPIHRQPGQPQHGLCVQRRRRGLRTAGPQGTALGDADVSQVVDLACPEPTCPKLGERLQPASRVVLSYPRAYQRLRVDTATRRPRVLQDDLTNSYSLVAA